MLATVSFDGLLETPAWAGLADAALASPALTGLAKALGITPYTLLTTFGLLGFAALLGAVYFSGAAAMSAAARSGGGQAKPGEMARLFVTTVVPIAIAYHLAHNLSYLLVAGQFIIPLISDPFGAGWNLFGTKLYLIRIDIISVRTVWYSSVGLIVVGHVIAVYLAHLVAERHFMARSAVLASQLPMMALMVGYTALSLWIRAQPITRLSGA